MQQIYLQNITYLLFCLDQVHLTVGQSSLFISRHFAMLLISQFTVIIIIITDLLWRRSTGAQQRLTKCA